MTRPQADADQPSRGSGIGLPRVSWWNYALAGGLHVEDDGSGSWRYGSSVSTGPGKCALDARHERLRTRARCARRADIGDTASMLRLALGHASALRPAMRRRKRAAPLRVAVTELRRAACLSSEPGGVLEQQVANRLRALACYGHAHAARGVAELRADEQPRL